MKSPFLKIGALFILSFLVTAIFSASLKNFFTTESWALNLSKGLLIPCFTWTVQIILSGLLLYYERRIIYWTQLGIACLVGSFALLPAAFYNFMAVNPSPLISVINVLISVFVMCLTLYFGLKSRRFNPLWTVSWAVTIIINMSLYLYSIS
jgi:hypothetical protein